MKAILIWGNQLTMQHHSALKAEPNAPIIMIESRSACVKYKYHKQKLRFVLTSMREYADELAELGRTVWYYKLEDSDDKWFKQLSIVCRKQGIESLIVMRQNDRSPQLRLEQWCKRSGIGLETTANTMFLTSTSIFNEWAEDQNRFQLETFYRWQRLRLGVLVQNGKPVGGKWNYDADNRKPLPKNATIPEIIFPEPSKHAYDIEQLIDKFFNDHPGSMNINWLPTSRSEAQHWIDDFTTNRLTNFGKYEDAMLKGKNFLYHSAISALMNIGLLHPSEVINKVLEADAPLSSTEGFVRQVIGWREFMFGLYNYRPLDWKNDNYLEQDSKMPSWWWDLSGSPEPPVTDVLQRLHSYGYNHHIERLMVLGNYMLVSDYNPQEVYDWFMTMYVDAYEWVMVGNIIGMSQFADGGIDNGGFASKPYISGSNYLQKMGSWWPTGVQAKESKWTPLYWEFLKRHQDKLSSNFRLRPLYIRFEK